MAYSEKDLLRAFKNVRIHHMDLLSFFEYENRIKTLPLIKGSKSEIRVAWDALSLEQKVGKAAISLYGCMSPSAKVIHSAYYDLCTKGRLSL